jgi:cysteine-rich repeat protein
MRLGHGRVHALALLALLLALSSLTSCSQLNREGPAAGCDELGGGRVNACQQGILAICEAGAMRYRVCPDEAACEAAWQHAGAFRCAEGEPLPEVCGDRVRVGAEACDDGNLVDDDGCDVRCAITGCGDRLVEGEETCDDGNALSGDGCDANCTVTACGNGIRTGAEVCDDGNLQDADGCDANCTPTACGNGQRAGAETCDDGDREDGDGCDSNCTPTACGNGVLTAGEDCEPGLSHRSGLCSDACTYLRVTQVITGNWHTCALFQDGGVRCWGSNAYGALGLPGSYAYGAAGPASDAPLVPLGQPVAELAAGAYHTCARFRVSGGVKCWGWNGVGQLGYGHTEDLGDDEDMDSFGLVSLPEPAIRIAAGGAVSCAILSSGALRCWGENDAGQLGLRGTTGGRSLGDDELPSDAPPVALGERASHVATGGGHTCAVLESGAVRCWGDNGAGQLGLGHDDAVSNVRHLPDGPVTSLGEAATAVAVGSAHSCALLASRAVRCWGENGSGQLALGNTRSVGVVELPSTTPPIPGIRARDLAVSGDVSCFIERRGEIYCAGADLYQSSGSFFHGFGTVGWGLGNTVIGDDEPVTAYGATPLGDPVVQLATANGRRCAVTQKGQLRCWGAGMRGELGYGNSRQYPFIGETDFAGWPGYVPVLDYPPSFLVASRLSATPEQEPNNTASSASSLRDDDSAFGARIGRVGDQDYFAVSVPAGHSILAVIASLTDPEGCPGPLFMRLQDANGAILGSDEDSGPNGCPRIDPALHPFAADLPAGRYFLRVEEPGNDAVIPELYRLGLQVRE